MTSRCLDTKRGFERASRSHKGMDAENIRVTSRYLDAGTRNPRQSDLGVGRFAGAARVSGHPKRSIANRNGWRNALHRLLTISA